MILLKRQKKGAILIMTAKEMLIEMNCCYMETQSGIWIDENVSYADGSSSRLCWIDKNGKKITFQDNENEHKLDLKLFLAIYFMMENSQANEYREFYNDKLIQNYYDPERIEKRDHPLNAQIIIYLYEMLNILIVDEKVQLLPIREGIINKLKIIKNISENRESNVKNYNVINDSIRQLKQSLINIRKKIPRLTD